MLTVPFVGLSSEELKGSHEVEVAALIVEVVGRVGEAPAEWQDVVVGAVVVDEIDDVLFQGD